jgi:hypothetical protein
VRYVCLASPDGMPLGVELDFELYAESSTDVYVRL